MATTKSVLSSAFGTPRRGEQRASSRRLLARVLELPDLQQIIPELPTHSLSALVHAVGLEDASELLALASTSQLRELFDEQLWSLDAGSAEVRLDTERLVLWLQVLSEPGASALAQRLLELPFDDVVLLVQRLILVVDFELLALQTSEANEDVEGLDDALAQHPSEEWEEFRLIARQSDGFEELVAALFELDGEHHDRLRAVFERCAALGSEWIAGKGGLYAVLSSDEMLEDDVRGEREERRARRGFVSFADARAFLELGRSGQEPDRRDAISAAYFRELERTVTDEQAPPPKPAVAQLIALIEEHSAATATRLLVENAAGADQGRPLGELVSGAEPAAELDSAGLLQRALEALFAADPELHAQRSLELGFVVNVLLTAGQHLPQAINPAQALELATSLLDAELSKQVRGAEDAARLLSSTSIDVLFRRAWHALAQAQARGELHPASSHATLVALLRSRRAVPTGIF